MNLLQRSGFPVLGAVCIIFTGAAQAGLPVSEDASAHQSDAFHGTTHQHDALEEIVVSATPLARDTVEMSQYATVLSGEALQREVTNNIGETLSRLPGLTDASFGQNVGRPVIRGLQGQRVGVLNNNMLASDASAVSQDHAVAIEPFLADQIEVLRGPSTLLYGSGSIGGVVNIVSHSIPQELPEGGLEGRAIGQFDTAANQRFAAGRIDFALSSFAFHADGFYRRTDDYDIPGAADLYPEEDHEEEEDHDEEDQDAAFGTLPNSFLDNEGGTLGGSWIGDTWQLGLSWNSYRSNYGIPGDSHHHHEGEDEHVEEEEHEEEGDHAEPEFVTIDLDSHRLDAELLGSDPFAGFEQFKLRYALTDYTHTELEGVEIGTVFDSSTNDVRFELRHDSWGAFNGAFGLQYVDVEFNAVGEEAFVPPSDTRTAGLFWVESADFDIWQLELGLRYEDVDLDVDELLDHDHDGEPGQNEETHEEGPVTRNFNPFSVSVGALWHVNDSSHIALTLARAERSPTAQELFSFGPHIASQTFEIGDPELETETNLHAELGYRIHDGPLTGSIFVYTDHFDDFIYQQNTGEELDELPVRLWAQQDANFVGGELELRYDFGHTEWGHWQVFGFADLVQAKLKNNENVPLMPPKRLGLGLEWDRGGWDVSMMWVHADGQDRLADYETPTPGYDLLGAEVSWLLPFSDRTSWYLFLKGQNLLDDDVRYSTSYLKDQAPQIGRNFVAGLRVVL